ncbi:hypothetical protein [Ruegeria profundi]|uniref:Uncharacterized protein n=1 Tax=Ruegeria profundi TaxID=1685378 RepID=A0A0X3U0J4_9RHOB|nr:hypothetical protein [Ruegeria profundi]KUJ81379.1 hypothetical protein AVO44_05900 [Ruegeria profundi]
MIVDGLLIGSLKRLLADHVALEHMARTFLWRRPDVPFRELVQADFFRLAEMTDDIGCTIVSEEGCPPILLSELATLASEIDLAKDMAPVAALAQGHCLILDDIDLLRKVSAVGHSERAEQLLNSLWVEHEALRAAYAGHEDRAH